MGSRWGIALIACALAVGAPGLGTAFEWPVEKRVLTATFGESRGNHLHGGVDLGGEEQPVHPVAAGEVIFSHEEGVDSSSLPIGLGNFVVLQHQGGSRSIYSHLKAGSLLPGVGRGGQVEPRQMVGLVGDSGYSQGRHLHLTLLDSETGTVLNPLQVLPPLPDRQPPRIRQIALQRRDGLQEVRKAAEVPSGKAEVLLETYDLREGVPYVWKLAPYRIVVNVNGQETLRLTFDSLRAEGGRLVLGERKLPFEKVYESEWRFRLGSVELVPGDTELQVLVRDFAGNEASQEVRLRVLP